jgi:CHAT domain-containing protein/Tfp pilus assembly protein PilF
MPRLLALAALLLLGCGGNQGSFDQDLLQARQWLRTEQFGLLLSRVDTWLKLAEQRGSPQAAAGFRLAKAGALLGAEKSAAEALDLLTKHGPFPPADRAQALVLQARATYALGRRQEVPALLDRAFQAATETKRPDLAAEVEFRRGFLLRDEGKFAAAQDAFDRVLATARQLQDRYLEARVENNRGTLLVAQARHDEAIPLLQRSRELALQVDARDTAARAEGNLGVSWFRLGDYDNARACFDIAEAEFGRVGNRFEAQIWTGNAGNVQYGLGDLRGAAVSYRRALDIAREVEAPQWEGRWLSNLAAIAIERGEWDSAEKFNTEARAVKARTNDKQYEASSLINAAQIAAGRGDSANARALFHDALRRNSEDPTVVLEAHMGLAQGEEPAAAEAEFRATIAQIEDRQSKLFKDDYRLSWLASLVRFYQKYVDFLMARNQPDRALEAAESSRSKVLSGQPIPPRTAGEYRLLAKRTGAVLLEYWMGPEHSYLWVITPEKVQVHVLPSKAELLPLIRSYRAVVTGGRNPLDVASDTGGKLYNALLAPAMQHAGAATEFIIVPDDELYSLNFETLPDGQNSNRFWIDRATVRIAPSLNYLAANAAPVHPKPRAGSRLLMIGDPVSPLAQYPHLEFASQEISSVRTAMAAADPIVVQGAAATPDSYAASRPGEFAYIHFSAHAAAAAKLQSALDSAVILSGPPGHYRLAARDVLAIPLTAELVTVSACRSAGGKTYGGEGMVGFAWAFMKAGAGNVIAGLWDVNDQSTVRLMTGLYSQIAKGAPAADALRSSKLALIHGGGSYARPFYWAPFQIYTARP